jgi:uncharacterized protein YsxB (DUF464 family)
MACPAHLRFFRTLKVSGHFGRHIYDRTVITLRMKFLKRNSTVVCFASVSLVVMTMLATTTIVAPIQEAKASQGNGPFLHLGNPNDLSTGPPIPSCTAPIQGHNDQAAGCKGRNVP